MKQKLKNAGLFALGALGVIALAVCVLLLFALANSRG